MNNKFIKNIVKKIDINELREATLAGFEFPNDYSIDNLLKASLNNTDCSEICFAINESSVKAISKLSFYNQLFLISLLFICYKKYECWFSEDFYLLFIKLIVNISKDGKEDILKLIKLLRDEPKFKFLDNFNEVIFISEILIYYMKKDYKALKQILKELNSLNRFKKDSFENCEIKEKIYDIIFKIIKDEKIKESILEFY